MVKFYACYNKRTGQYLPGGGRGYTHRPAALPEDAVPRLHLSASSARQALRYWLQGKYVVYRERSYSLEGPDDYEQVDVVSVPGRDPDDWDVISVYVSRGENAST